MANEIVMSPVYRGVKEAIGIIEENEYAAAAQGHNVNFALSSLHSVREAVEDRTDSEVTGRRAMLAVFDRMFEPTSIEFDPTEVVG